MSPKKDLDIVVRRIMIPVLELTKGKKGDKRRDGKKEDYISIFFGCSYSRFFFLPPSSCFRH
jgi:hypothetical protein